ncbi:MAG: hypothetical protein SVX38_06425 [Chloroflexota bacterium]|nr:hypothetical protein [Chloroflexota bacterium]
MAEDKGKQQSLEAEGQMRKVQQALSLGWTLAEILGRWRQGITPPRKAKSDERLSFSSREVLPGDALGMAAQRALVLARNLNLEVTQPSDDSDVGLASLPELVYAYMEDSKGNPLPDVKVVRPVLEEWSRAAWITLAARSHILSTAFSVGGSLADTYWYMCPPDRDAKRKVREKETWRDLLSRQRLGWLMGHLRRLEESLPPEVASALIHGLDQWGIAAELERRRDGRLHISYRLLFALRRFSWARRLRYRLKQRKFGSYSGMVVDLSDDEEQALYETLHRQAEIWDDLVRGDRQPASYLRSSDWEWVNWLSRIAYAGLILLGGALSVAAVSALLPVFNLLSLGVSSVANRALPSIADGPVVKAPIDPKVLSGWFSVIATLSTFVVFVSSMVARSFRAMMSLYDRLHDWFARRRIWTRTTVPWNWAFSRSSR